MNFVKSSSNYAAGPTTQWTNNPVYQSPEMAGVSWYDQATHWDPNSEGIQSIASFTTNDPNPYWAFRDTTQQGLESLWSAPAKNNTYGLGYSPATVASQEASIASSVNPAITSELAATTSRQAASTASESLVSGSETAAKAVQGVEGMFSFVPGGTALLVNSMAGDATAAGIGATKNTLVAEDYKKNALQTGSQSGFQAQLIRDMEQMRANNITAGARIGGVLGPLGAWFGSMIADAIQNSAPRDVYNDYKTGYSFEGKYNPQDTGAVNSGTTSDLTGQSNMIENV